MWRIVLPHLVPALRAATVIAFFQSIENFNTTLFTAGNSSTLTIYVFSQVRAGITPKMNALATVMMAVCIAGIIVYDAKRRRATRMLAGEHTAPERDEPGRPVE